METRPIITKAQDKYSAQQLGNTALTTLAIFWLVLIIWIIAEFLQ